MQQSKPRHRVRTFFASFFGIIAVSLVMSSLVIVWLNRTLTNTQTYVNTVAPLASKPDVQNFIADKTTTELLKNASKVDLANALLPEDQRVDKNTDQLIVVLEPLIHKNVLQVIQGPEFAALWKTSNQTAHQEFIKQLDSNQPNITLHLHPLASGVVSQLKASQLSAVTDQLQIKDNAVEVDLTGSGITKIRQAYRNLHTATWVVVAATLVFLALAIIISTHHLKTIRRILIGSGVLLLLLAFSVKAASYVSVGNNNDEITRKATISLVQTLLHNLQLASLILGAAFILIAIALKVFSVHHDKTV
ncbi:MAG: hypothetical protein ABIQ89_03755 [Candidatus Saccharimonadales bacterium]